MKFSFFFSFSVELGFLPGRRPSLSPLNYSDTFEARALSYTDPQCKLPPGPPHSRPKTTGRMTVASMVRESREVHENKLKHQDAMIDAQIHLHGAG